MINIRGKEAVNDPHYRYRMPALLTALEGKRNGAKTVLVNLPDVAKSLQRSAEEIMQFFAKDLGAQGKFKASEGKYILRGEHTAATLQNRLFIYIENFVLCPTCGNPETQYRLRKWKNLPCQVHLKGKPGANSRKAHKAKIFLQCAACGSTSKVDMERSLCKQIVKDYAKSQENPSTRKDHSSKKKSEKLGKSESFMRVNKKMPENFRVGNHKESSSIEKNQASVDMEGKSNGNNEQFISHAIMQLKAFIKTGEDAHFVLKEALRLETIGCFPKGTHVEILIRALFDSSIRGQIPSKSEICRELCKDTLTSVQFICTLEILTLEHPVLVPRFPLILKDMYEEGILEEEPILQWGKREATRCPHSHPQLTDANLNDLLRASAPLIRWLENADVEDCEDVGCNE